MSTAARTGSSAGPRARHRDRRRRDRQRRSGVGELGQYLGGTANWAAVKANPRASAGADGGGLG
ncbi:hypothetical protein [Streptomyces sp. NBC_01750]|uniref:hypothetical protein n=1 Tax=Streptomyces sp. NBC_01750 TaxID=2975928 RepID=UPI002DDC4F03|nr:hypothetical protein [Streptomyces sp. NBC_01750]WSD33265.1 hypothetical protein OG966_15925 [Streptomyces sp. NBC_01750]